MEAPTEDELAAGEVARHARNLNSAIRAATERGITIDLDVMKMPCGDSAKMRPHVDVKAFAVRPIRMIWRTDNGE
jgi:hypothetical protein